MQNINKKYAIKIPSNIIIIYCEQKRIIIIHGSAGKRSLKLKTKITILQENKLIQVSSSPFSKISNNDKKKIKSIQGTTVALIKQAFIETSAILYQKLRFIGVGYRAFDVENFKNELVFFRLGYSHSIYFKIPNKLKIFSLKFTNLFIYGNSYKLVTQTASSIRQFKKPEPYKGKGILYDNEKILLKEGKKG